MKNLLELHADASDEVSLLDDSEVVQYVVGDVRGGSRAGLCYLLGCFPTLDGACAAACLRAGRAAAVLSFPVWHRALSLPAVCPFYQSGVTDRLGFCGRLSGPPTLVMLTREAAVFFA